MEQALCRNPASLHTSRCDTHTPMSLCSHDAGPADVLLPLGMGMLALQPQVWNMLQMSGTPLSPVHKTICCMWVVWKTRSGVLKQVINNVVAWVTKVLRFSTTLNITAIVDIECFSEMVS